MRQIKKHHYKSVLSRVTRRARISSFLVNNYLILLSISIFIIISSLGIIKLSFSSPDYVYARVKVSQGLWWAQTGRPSVWFMESLKKGAAELDFLGKPRVRIMAVRYYPWFTSNQFDIYLDLKLQAQYDSKRNHYTYNRALVAPGAPLDFEFNTAVISGTVIAVSHKPFKDRYIKKIVTLVKKLPDPWETEAVALGGTFFDGEQTVVNISEKELEYDSPIYLPTAGKGYSASTLYGPTLKITAEILVKQTRGNYVFGEEYIVARGKTMSFMVNDFVFDDFVITAIR